MLNLFHRQREPALKACEKRGLLPTLARRSTSNRHGGWDRDRFTYVPERDVLVCPAGHAMRHSNENLRFPSERLSHRQRDVSPLSTEGELQPRPERAFGDASVGRRVMGGLRAASEITASSSPPAPPKGGRRTDHRRLQDQARPRPCLFPGSREDADTGSPHSHRPQYQAAGAPGPCPTDRERRPCGQFTDARYRMPTSAVIGPGSRMSSSSIPSPRRTATVHRTRWTRCRPLVPEQWH